MTGNRRKKNKGRTTKLILVGLALFLLIFTITMIVIFIYEGSVPDTLIVSIFGICGGECGILGWIKTTKEREASRKEQIEDRLFELRKGEIGYDDFNR